MSVDRTFRGSRIDSCKPRSFPGRRIGLAEPKRGGAGVNLGSRKPNWGLSRRCTGLTEPKRSGAEIMRGPREPNELEIRRTVALLRQNESISASTLACMSQTRASEDRFWLFWVPPCTEKGFQRPAVSESLAIGGSHCCSAARPRPNCVQRPHPHNRCWTSLNLPC